MFIKLRPNSFHNLEHASHVTMSVTKLLARIVTSDSIDYKDLQYKQMQDDGQLHEYTYGITSDPLIHFACALSALIHDVDHTGVPNSQLIKENAKIAKTYKNKSVAEQNSVDLSWNLFMKDKYKEIRNCICPTQEEMNRFRYLVVNCVMATDIVDKELGALRKKWWNIAFGIGEAAANYTPASKQEDVNRKATIVIEHLIQASDVAHTMQHWHVYIKWVRLSPGMISRFEVSTFARVLTFRFLRYQNAKFFNECYHAYKMGRAEKDPSDGWYKVGRKSHCLLWVSEQK